MMVIHNYNVPFLSITVLDVLFEAVLLSPFCALLSKNSVRHEDMRSVKGCERHPLIDKIIGSLVCTTD